MNNLSSYCGLADAKIRASDKNLPVHQKKAMWHSAIWQNWCFGQFCPSRIKNQTLSLILLLQRDFNPLCFPTSASKYNCMKLNETISLNF